MSVYKESNDSEKESNDSDKSDTNLFFKELDQQIENMKTINELPIIPDIKNMIKTFIKPTITSILIEKFKTLETGSRSQHTLNLTPINKEEYQDYKEITDLFGEQEWTHSHSNLKFGFDVCKEACSNLKEWITSDIEDIMEEIDFFQKHTIVCQDWKPFFIYDYSGTGHSQHLINTNKNSKYYKKILYYNDGNDDDCIVMFDDLRKALLHSDFFRLLELY